MDPGIYFEIILVGILKGLPFFVLEAFKLVLYTEK